MYVITVCSLNQVFYETLFVFYFFGDGSCFLAITLPPLLESGEVGYNGKKTL